MPRFAAFLLALLITQSSYASLAIPSINTTPIKIESNALAKAGVSDIQDEVIEQKDFKLSEAQKHQAKVWQLTEQEEKRYIQLMQSRSGIYYKGLRLSPVDILGLNARDDDERAHFADLSAKQEAQKVAQNIAWNNAFYKSYNQLFKSVPVVGDFNLSPYSPYSHKPIELKPGQQLYLFLKTDDAVKTTLLHLIDAINQAHDTKLNLFFIGMSKEAIQLWANRNQIPITLVIDQKITLNNGTQYFDSLQIDNKHTPLLLLSEGKESHIVDMGRF